MDFLSPFPFLSGGSNAPRPLQPGPLSNMNLRAANPNLQLEGRESCFFPSPLWIFSFESNYLLSHDGKREISKRQQLSEHPPFISGQTGNFSISKCFWQLFFPSFPPLPSAFGKLQLISKRSVAAGGWYKGLIICLFLGKAGTGRRSGPIACHCYSCPLLLYDPSLPPPSLPCLLLSSRSPP